MALPWFRFHTDFLDNPKVRLLSEKMQLRYVQILCIRRKEDKMGEGAVIWHWRHLSKEDITETKRALLDADLIDKSWNPTGWDKRQYVSDDVTARTRKFKARAKSKLSTLQPEQNRPEEERSGEQW